MAASSSYSGKDIQVLEGLEPVRKNPGMYIGGSGKPGLHHLLWEIVDNAVDEACNGYASKIEVTLHRGYSAVTVRDNGRGIPVDLHPEKKKPALEVILTTLHSGGKFDSSQYVTSGGLHGVGASVVNALSKRLVATVRRDGDDYRQEYSRGTSQSALQMIASGVRGTGTTIFFEPDPEIFGTIRFDSDLVRRRLETKAYLNRSLHILFKDEQAGTRDTFHFDGGIAEYLTKLVHDSGAAVVSKQVFTLMQEKLNEGVRLEVALQWTEAPTETVFSFVNGIPTPSGGTHVQGFKDAVRAAVRAYMDTHDLSPIRLDISADDMREGLIAIINLFMVDPQFQGQTKEKLNNPSVRSVVNSTLRITLEDFLNYHPTASSAIVARVIQSAKARQASRKAARSVRRQTALSKRLNLPGKLADCSSTKPDEAELFIVEGDSAGGSAKQGRDRTFQAVLPLRGKVLNTEQASLRKVLKNNELSNVVSALGCGIGTALNLDRLRYHKVILLMDADSDGHHIATLLLTFFYRHMRPLLDEGFIYVAEPPLYRIDAAKESHWALDDVERDRICRRLRQRRANIKIEIQRFKGLGEMMPATLKQTTLDPARRRLLQITIPRDEQSLTETTIKDLMGNVPSRRYTFIMENAGEVEELDV